LPVPQSKYFLLRRKESLHSIHDNISCDEKTEQRTNLINDDMYVYIEIVGEMSFEGKESVCVSIERLVAGKCVISGVRHFIKGWVLLAGCFEAMPMT
jgi:hypothetical protein